MRNTIATILGLGGLAVLAGFAAVSAIFWTIEIIPFFWARGNPWPGILTAALGSFIAGMALYKEPTV
jgi:hypothetical protein